MLVHRVPRSHVRYNYQPGFGLDLINDSIPVAAEPHPVKVRVTLHLHKTRREGIFGEFSDGLNGFQPHVFVELAKLPTGAGAGSNVPE